VYLETRVISYLAARPSRDDVISVHQRMTRQWWEQRDRYELYVSDLVLSEAAAGDTEAAQRRLELLAGLPRLQIDARVDELVECLLEDEAVPRGSDADAVHVAIATVNSMGFLVTWNLRHLAGAFALARLRASCEAAGYVMPTICTPEQFIDAPAT
jgi:hypothetical protein